MTDVRTEAYVGLREGNGGEKSPTYVSWRKQQDSETVQSPKTCSERLKKPIGGGGKASGK